MSVRISLVAIAALALGACATPDDDYQEPFPYNPGPLAVAVGEEIRPEAEPAAAPVPATARRVAVTGTVVAAQPLAGLVTASEPGAEPTTEPAPVPALAPVLAPRAGHLAHLSLDQVIASLGPPRLRRWEGPAQLYQFMRADCVLDIVAYEPTEGAPMEIRHVEARDPRGVPGDADACLAAMLPGGLWPAAIELRLQALGVSLP